MDVRTFPLVHFMSRHLDIGWSGCPLYTSNKKSLGLTNDHLLLFHEQASDITPSGCPHNVLRTFPLAHIKQESTGCISVNTRPHQLRWGDREMGTAISCTECSQVAGLIQKVGRSSSKASSLRAAVFRLKIVAIITGWDR